jgi:glucan 1,3-beta-glucosidase
MAEDRPLSTAQTEYATPAPSLPPSLPVVDSSVLQDLEAPLEPPRASFLAPGLSIASSPRDSRVDSTAGAENEKGYTPGQSTAYLQAGRDSLEATPLQPVPKSRPFYRRPLWLAIAAGALVAVVLAVALPVALHKSKNAQSNNGKPGSGGPGSGNPNNPKNTSNAITGGDGSTIISGNTSFIYNNSFGGIWYYDPSNPFKNAAQPNSWTPALNTSWNWSTDRVYGVNLGGWFVTEPFITPALFQKYPTAIDEWTLSLAMAADTGPGGGLESQLVAHYETFITEKDFAEIAGAGLNWIRIPIPYWAIEVWSGEPFLEKVCWPYILRSFEWARKYGLRIYLDLHTIPGSQNAFNHSGKQGQVNFLNGLMGIANAQRALDYIRIITEFISQEEYQNLIPLWGIVNEALLTTIGQPALISL